MLGVHAAGTCTWGLHAVMAVWRLQQHPVLAASQTSTQSLQSLKYSGCTTVCCTVHHQNPDIVRDALKEAAVLSCREDSILCSSVTQAHLLNPAPSGLSSLRMALGLPRLGSPDGNILVGLGLQSAPAQCLLCLVNSGKCISCRRRAASAGQQQDTSVLVHKNPK